MPKGTMRGALEEEDTKRVSEILEVPGYDLEAVCKDASTQKEEPLIESTDHVDE